MTRRRRSSTSRASSQESSDSDNHEIVPPPPRIYKQQIENDVRRAFAQFSEELPPSQLCKLRIRLKRLLYRIFAPHRQDLHYYQVRYWLELDLFISQGFHDICSVLLLANDSSSFDGAFLRASSLSKSHLADFLKSDMHSIHRLIDVMLEIIKCHDPLVGRKLDTLAVPPFFGVSWMLTWFTHDVYDSTRALAYVTWLEGSHPSAILYASAAMVICNREEFLNSDSDDPAIHQWLKTLPAQTDHDLVIRRADRLQKTIPIGNLKSCAPLKG